MSQTKAFQQSQPADKPSFIAQGHQHEGGGYRDFQSVPLTSNVQSNKNADGNFGMGGILGQWNPMTLFVVVAVGLGLYFFMGRS